MPDARNKDGYAPRDRHDSSLRCSLFINAILRMHYLHLTSSFDSGSYHPKQWLPWREALLAYQVMASIEAGTVGATTATPSHQPFMPIPAHALQWRKSENLMNPIRLSFLEASHDGFPTVNRHKMCLCAGRVSAGRSRSRCRRGDSGSSSPSGASSASSARTNSVRSRKRSCS